MSTPIPFEFVFSSVKTVIRFELLNPQPYFLQRNESVLRNWQEFLKIEGSFKITNLLRSLPKSKIEQATNAGLS